ncbi:nuclear transport factor 2 family protein, partial [Rhodococcus sp. CX]|uniref:nuclear transport factor 2 family protein n=1 Tax=Rhodococcus sp. CX TaxID=2789880 RepID=UPI0018CFDE36
MTETTSKSERFELSDTIERYVRFWNPGAGDALTAETLAEDVEYCAPVGVLTGQAALVDFRRQFTDHMGS